ncbi:hypothetical protein L6164_033211 [Bauhinia variegata]|uniref:Uncharacterized protein n=1 Tax=Bauhinia variegata TaxID=167791 RepID=A0ACB9KR37_BAUVA|nr:hypothetical protein L6164_033211 [Bauhinia variegata]
MNKEKGNKIRWNTQNAFQPNMILSFSLFLSLFLFSASNHNSLFFFFFQRDNNKTIRKAFCSSKQNYSIFVFFFCFKNMGQCLCKQLPNYTSSKKHTQPTSI